MKKILALLLPISLLASSLNHKATKEYDNTLQPRIYLKGGPASTIYFKTRIRPFIGISYRAHKDFLKLFNAYDISLSYSYNNVENEKRSFSIGEFFVPKVLALKYTSPKEASSFYYGLGGGMGSSWQKETHSKSPSLLSSKDDNLYNVHSFFFFGTYASAIIGYEVNRSSEITSGIQLELNTPLYSMTKASKGAKSPLSIEISFIAGF